MALRDARGLRAARRDLPDKPPAVFAEPESILGPFESLPLAAQRALVEAVTQDDRWRMAGYFLGWRHADLTRRLWRLRNRMPWASKARAAAEILASAVQASFFLSVPAARRRFTALRLKFVQRTTMASVLAAAGIEVRDLAVRYVRAVPQRAAYLGFWHDPTRHNTVGLIVGVDLIHNAQGYWFIESNLNCGLGARGRFFRVDDPFVRSLFDFVGARGYRRLVFVSGSTSVPPETSGQFREAAAARGTDLALYEDAFNPRWDHRRTARLPELDASDTLLVRNRHYKTALDWVVHHKRASGRALRIYKEESGDGSFQLPLTSSEPCVGPADPSDPFPNLVFKFPESDAGEGVLFLKVASVSHARKILGETLRAAPRRGVVSRLYTRLQDRQGVFQPYVRTPWGADRRLHKTRAYVLLTPIGVHFLAAHRVVCAKPIPEDLPMGIVHDQAPYLVSVRPGSELQSMPQEEEPLVREAALGVARGLARALEHGFQTGPEST